MQDKYKYTHDFNIIVGEYYDKTKQEEYLK